MQNLEKIINWANSLENIKILILSGSLAAKGKKDELSDYDIAVYGTDFNFIENDDWLKNIQEYWVCIHDQFLFSGYDIPTRLTIFNAYFKVDFSFHPMDLLHKMINSKTLPDDYNIGYKVLLDKENITNKLLKPTYTGFILSKPNKEKFQENIKEFWFESYHVAKYLYRNDLWTAKMRDWSTKELLRQMLEWNEACKQTKYFSPKNHGKEMKSQLNENIWQELEDCFGKFDKKDSWRTLNNTIKLYRKVAVETAKILGFTYDQKPDQHISAFIENLKINFQ